MSEFDKWMAKEPGFTAPRLTQERMRNAFNAGMARAAGICREQAREAGFPAPGYHLACASGIESARAEAE